MCQMLSGNKLYIGRIHLIYICDKCARYSISSGNKRSYYKDMSITGVSLFVTIATAEALETVHPTLAINNFILLPYNITLFDVNHNVKYIIVDLFLLIMMVVCSETFS